MKNNLFYSSLEESLKILPERSKFIIKERFGIDNDEAKTLDAIGKKNNITRERVRQLVNASISQINEEKNNQYIEAQDIIKKYVESVGGVIFHDRFIDYMRDNYEVNKGVCNFYIYASQYIDFIQNNSKKPFVFAVFKKDFDFDKWNDVHNSAKNLFKKQKKVATFEELFEEVTDKVDGLSPDNVREYLYVSRNIKNNPFDEWGFSEWNEISPKGVRDKVFLVLKHTNKAMHFREIAKAIDKYGLNNSKRATHPQTVHNELIKDGRFYLTGRGTYKLSSKKA